MKNLIKWTLIVVVFIAAMIVVYAIYNNRDRHPGYSVDLSIPHTSQNTQFSVGFGKRPITPTITDTWNDTNRNARYDKGETYNDNNNNGQFDAVWIAGFHNNKPANGIHDDVWSRAVVIDDGKTRIALVSLDAVGFMHPDVIDIRQAIPKELNIDYTLISSTHTHESNDLVGIWGPDIFHSGVDPVHMKWLKEQVVNSIEEACNSLRPAKFIFGQDLSGRDSILIKDTRKPIVKATGIQMLQVLDAESDTTLGTVVNWSNHPETLWSKNLLISSDYPHYVRESLENGIIIQEDTLSRGLGGTSIFFSGIIGGLMAPHPSLTIYDSLRNTAYSEPSFEKARAIGEQVALWSMASLKNSDTLETLWPIQLEAKTITLPVKNTIFRIASSIGLLNRGMTGWFKTKSEVAGIRMGPATFLSIPGELYPEIVYGGIEAPPGQDYPIGPVEIPPLQEFMPGDYHYYIGLSNDEIGYIIPKSEWDAKEPWLYLDESSTYGEVNSLGPETAPILYHELRQILEKIDVNPIEPLK